MALDPKLLEILACPEDKGSLLYFESEQALYNPRLKRRYEIRDDIPVMLVDEATTVDDAEHDRLLAKAEAESTPSTLSCPADRRGRRHRLPAPPRGHLRPARADGRGRPQPHRDRPAAGPRRDR